MLSSPIYAALDLGSNSFHLLLTKYVAEQLVVIDDCKLPVQLAAGLQADKNLSEQALSDALDVLAIFSEKLQSVDRRNVRIIGTSTLRQAKNADDFLQQAEQILQAPIDIISGVEEARLTFLGVNKACPAEKKRLIIDIGGGSTECVVGENHAELLKSLYIGCVQFATKYFPEGKLDAASYQKALLAARTEAQTIAEQVRQSGWQEAVGSSGTVRCIQQVIHQAYQQESISLQSLERLSADLIQQGVCCANNYPFLSDNHRMILPGGLAVLHGLFIELGIQAIATTDQAIREGIIHEMADQKSRAAQQELSIQHLQQQYHVDVLQARRVAVTANTFLGLLDKSLAEDKAMVAILQWAAQLHEIGLPINRNGYQRHGAYIIESSPMLGFTLQVQQSIVFLVANHRRKIRPNIPPYRVCHSESLLIALRLAFIFCRQRTKPALPENMQLQYNGAQLSLYLNASWLAEHALLEADLQQEAGYLQAIGVELLINPKACDMHSKGQ